MTRAPLTPGDIIGVFAPGGYVEPQDLTTGIEFLKSYGYETLIHPQTYLRHHQSAGTHAEKIQALYDLLQNPDVSVIIAAGGGNRTLHLLDKIDWQFVEKHKKPVIGFSDVTALLNSFFARCGQQCVHGPVLKHVKNDRQSIDLMSLLQTGEITYQLQECTIFTPGHVQAPLVGGNLTLIHHMINTPFLPDMKGKILFIEDINEELSRFDRTLCHLRQSGILARLSGLVIGSFANMQDSGRPFGFSFEDVIKEHVHSFDFPVIYTPFFGHGTRNLPLAIGGILSLTANKTGVKITSSLTRD